MAKFTIANEASRQTAIKFIEGLSIDKTWICEVKKKTKKRSLSQNNLMWAWLDKVAKEASRVTGYTTNEIHEIFKEKFLQPEIRSLGGEDYKIYSTKDLSTIEMSEYMSSIDRFCASDLGIFLPHPQDAHLHQDTPAAPESTSSDSKAEPAAPVSATSTQTGAVTHFEVEPFDPIKDANKCLNTTQLIETIDIINNLISLDDFMYMHSKNIATRTPNNQRVIYEAEKRKRKEIENS